MNGEQGPWSPTELAAAGLISGLGVTALVAGWVQASGTATLAHQYAAVNLGVGGLILIGFGNGLVLMAGRRAVALRTAQVDERIGRRMPGAPGRGTGPVTSAGPRQARGGRVAAEGMRHHHDPSCQLVLGKLVAAVDLAEGRPPCPMCGP